MDYQRLANNKNTFGWQDCFLIEAGMCHIKYDGVPFIIPEEKQIFSDLTPGSYFGEQRVFKVPSLNYFGNIYAGAHDAPKSEITKVFRISRANMERIPFFERSFYRTYQKNILLPF